MSFPSGAGEPPRVLRGFSRLSLNPGETETVSIELTPRDFSCWNASTHARGVPTGSYRIAIGGSSREQPLHADLDVIGAGF